MYNCLPLFRTFALLLLMSLCVAPAAAQTTVSSLVASPDPFNVDRSDTTLITVTATPGLTNLAVRIFAEDQVTLVRNPLSLTESTTAGTYTTSWDGRNNSGNFVPSGPYRMRAFNLATTTDVGPYAPLAVSRFAESITITPNPFTPDGTSEVTFTVVGEPGATDLEIYYGESGERRFPLTETPAGSGNYTVSSTLMMGSTIPANANRTVYVRTTDGVRYSRFTTTLQVRTFSSFTRDKGTYFPTLGDTATFTAAGVAGQLPKAIIYRSGERQTGTVYEREWSTAAFAPSVNRVYVAGDPDGTAGLWVESAPVLAGGRLGAFARDNQLPEARQAGAMVFHAGWLYYTGGYLNGEKNTIFRAPVNPDGTLGAWITDATPLPTTLWRHGAVAHGGYLYLAGQWSGGRNTWIAPLNADGSVGTFQAGPQLLIGRSIFPLVKAGDYLYALGGYSAESSIERALINGDGTLSPWEAAGSLGTGRYGHLGVLVNDRFVIAGGYNSSLGYLATVETIQVNADGTVGNSVDAGTLNLRRYTGAAMAAGNRAYFIGGYSNGIGRLRGVEFSTVGADGTLGTNPPDFSDYGEFDLAETTPGNYSFLYNFRDESGSEIPRDSYDVYLYQQGTDYYYQASTTFSVDFGVTSVVGEPNPFVPDGVREATITVVSDPGQRNVRYNVASIEKPLTESSPGVYTAKETFVRNGAITAPGTYTISFRNEAGGYNAVTGSIQLRHTGSLSVSPTDVTPSEGETANFTVTGEASQPLEVRIYRDSEDVSGMTYRRTDINHSATRVGDRLYVTGGNGTTNAQFTPEWTKIQGDRSLRTWLPQNRTSGDHRSAALAATANAIYAIGGYSTDSAAVEYATFNADGSIGVWQTTSSLPEPRGLAPAIATDTHIYLFGGYRSGGKNTIYRAAIQGDSSLGAWESIGTLPAAIYGGQATRIGSRIYFAGGYAGAYRTQTYVTEVQGDGSLSALIPLTSMNQSRYLFGLVAEQGWLFAVGGEGATDSYSIERAQILGDGTLGAWELLTVTSPRPHRFALVGGGNGRMYMMGGDGQQRGVYFADVAADGTLSPFSAVYLGRIPMTEDPAGTYKASWDGRDSNGQLCTAGDYTGYLFSTTSGLSFSGRSAGFRLRDSLATFEVTPQPFINTGLNTATFRATGSPGQVGLYTSWDRTIFLTETSPGVYEAPFAFIRTNGNLESEYTNNAVYLYDASGNYSGLSTTVTIRNVRSYTTTPASFSPSPSGDVRSEFSLTGEPELNLTARLYEGNERTTGLLTARRYIGTSTFAHDGRIYVIGGENNSGQRSATGEVIDVNADGTFERPRSLRPMITSRAYAAAVAYNGWVYSVGGYQSRSLSSVERAPILPDGRLGEWQACPPLGTERYVLAAVAHNGWLYALGGYHTNQGSLSSIERAPIAADGSLGPWETSTQALPDRRYGPAAAVRDNYLYIFGGYSNMKQVWRSALAADGTLGTWEALASLSHDRYQHAVAISGDRVFVVGSEYSPGYNIIESAEFQADGTLSAWTAQDVSPEQFQFAGAGVVNGHLYVLGGAIPSVTYARAIRRAAIASDGTLGAWTAPMLPEAPLLRNDTDFRYSWNGLDSEGKVVGQGTYTWYAYNTDSGRFYSPSRTVSVVPTVQSVTVDTPELIVDGTNVATVTVESLPGVEGMYLHFSSPQTATWNYSGGATGLTETEPGIYVGRWNGVVQSSGPLAIQDGTFTVYVYDQAGRQMDATKTLAVKGISGISVATEFTPGGGSTLPIVLNGAEGLDPLVTIENVSTGFLVRELAAIEASGTYTAQWDGRDANGNFTGPNSYRIRVYNDSTPRIRYGSTTTFTVRQAVFNLEVSPNPFTPIAQTATITVLADAGQTGLTAEVTHPSGPVRTGIALTEQGSAGTFSGTWDGRDNGGAVMPDGVAIVNIRNGSGQLFPISGSVTISTISRFDISPNPFTPQADPTITFRVDMLAGLELEARVGAIQRVDLSDAATPGQYVGTWNGRVAGGDFAPAGQYNVTLANKASGLVYSEARTLTINVVDLTPPRATIAWAAPAPPLGIGPRSFTLQASEPLKAAPSFTLTPFAGEPITATFGAATNGGRNWPGTLTIPANAVNGTATFAWSGSDNANNIGTAFTHSNTIAVDVIGPVASINVAPSFQGSFGAGTKTVTVTLNEQASSAPTVTFTPPQGGPVSVPVTGGPTVWIGSLNATPAMGNGAATFAMTATDRVGNSGSTISGGAEWTIDLVPPGPPSTLTASAQAGGRVALAWIGAPGQPYNYQLWRVAGSADPLSGTQVAASLFTNSYTDTPPGQGTWSYAVTASDRAGNTGAKSNVAQATSDSTPPAAPTNLQASLVGDQVQLAWTAPAGEAATSYRVYYRAGSTAISSTSQASRITEGIVGTTASVTAQPVGAQHYAVTALDAVGNESAVSNSRQVQYESPLPATTGLAIAYDSTRGASLTWPAVAGAAGYNVYRDGSKLNAAPIIPAAYFDADAPPTANAVYTVRAVTASGAPGNPFQGTFRPARVEVAQSALTIEPNLILPFAATVTNTGAAPITTTQLRLDFLATDGSSLQNRTQPFSQALAASASASLNFIEGISTYPARLRSTATISTGETGVTLTAVREQPLTIRPAGVRVEAFAEPLIRGVAAQVRLRFTNASTLPIDIVTAVGTDPSPDVTVEITDVAGTVLGSAFLNQRGNGVFSTPGYAKIVLQPGESFLTDAVAPVVPLDAPQTVLVRGKALRTYWNYGAADQVQGPAWESAPVASQPTETDYRGIVSSDAPLYGLGATVTLTGRAISNASGNPVGNVPLRLGVDVRGFRRFYTVQTDAAGNFAYAFTPFANEFGRYTAWAVHPTVTDRPAQAQWNIAGITLPSPVSLRMAKNSSLNFTLTATSRSEIPMTGLAISWLPDANSGSVQMAFNLPATTLPAGGTLGIGVTATAPIDAPSGAFGTFRLTSAEGLVATAQVNMELRPAQPSIRSVPSFISAQLSTNGSYATQIEIENVGFDDLRNARLGTPSAPWVQYTVDPELGNIPPGGKKVIGVVLQPGGTKDPGNYTEQFTLLSDNSATITYNVFATLTSSNKGNVLFHAEDVLSPALAGATVEIGSVYTGSLFFRGTTDAEGNWLAEDLPTGDYNYRVSASGHTPVTGRVQVKADTTEYVRAFLTNSFVTVAWEVVPVPLEDRYEITLKTTFETNVPAPVLIADPPSLVHPMTRPGVSYANFRVTNRGLIAGNDFRISPRTSSPGMKLEVLVDVVDTILPMQTIEIPYRVVLDAAAQPAPESLNYEQVPGFPAYDLLGMPMEDYVKARKTDIPIPDADCGLSGQLLAILNYLCRLESISTGVDHSVKPEIAAAAVGIGGALDPASVLCASTGCDDCCVAIAGCVLPAPGTLGTPSCLFNAAKCLAKFFPSPGSSGIGVSGSSGDGGGGGAAGGGYGGAGFSPCAPTGAGKSTLTEGGAN